MDFYVQLRTRVSNLGVLSSVQMLSPHPPSMGADLLSRNRLQKAKEGDSLDMPAQGPAAPQQGGIGTPPEQDVPFVAI